MAITEPNSSDTSDNKALSNAEALAGKYMTFKLAEEEYGLQILKVREIIGVLQITRLPRSPAFLRGVINLRGRVIPVVDLRRKFGMDRADHTFQSVIIVVQYQFKGNDITTGILVDEVVEVLDIAASRVEPPPNYTHADLDEGFILGVGKADDRIIFLLDIGRVLTQEDTEGILSSIDQQKNTEDAQSDV